MDTSLPPPTPEAGQDRPVAPPALGEFGKMVRAYRKDLRLTLEALSEATGLNLTTLSLMEGGKRPPPELTDVFGLARVLQIAGDTSTYERFVALAIEERSKFKRRGKRKPYIPRKVAHRRPFSGPTPPVILALDGPVPTEQTANATVGPEGRDAILAKLLRTLLNLDLAEKIDYIRVSTKAGQEYVIRTDPPEEDL